MSFLTAKKRSSFFILGFLVLASGAAVLHADRLLSLGRTYFDLSNSSCDLYYPYGPSDSAGPVNPDSTQPMCDKTNRSVVVWSGQSESVHVPIDSSVTYNTRNDLLSTPTSRIRAVFKNLPDANGDGQVEKASMNKDDAVVVIKGAHMCKDEPNYNANRGDITDGNFYGDRPAAYADIPAGYEVTQYAVGGERYFGTIRYSADYCSGSKADISVDLKTAGVGINPVQGVDNHWYVEIVIRHIDVTSRRPEAGDGPNDHDGIANKALVAITSASNKAVEVAPSGTEKRRDDEFNATRGEGYVGTLQRVGNGNGAWGWLADPEPFDKQNYSDSRLVESHYASYMVRFGSSCDPNIGTNTGDPNANPRYRIMFFDIDRQLSLFGGSAAYRAARITLYDETNRRWLWPADTVEPTVDRASFTPTPGSDSFKLADGVWRGQDVKPSYNQMIIPPQGNGEYYAVSFPALQGHKYRLHIANVENGLVFQYGVPFDSIYYSNDCDLVNARVREEVKWTDAGGRPVTALEGGESATFTTTLRNPSSRLATVNQARVRVWKELNGAASGFNAADGDQNLSGIGSPWTPISSNTSIASGPPQNLQTGSTTGDVNFSFLCADVYNVVGVTVGSVQTIVVDDPPVCVKIGKYPALKVYGGDVRSGGVYPDTDGISRCILGSNRSLEGYMIRAHDYGGTKGSTAENAVLTPGPITQFGSGNLPYRYGPAPNDNDSSIKLLFGTDKWLKAFPYESSSSGEESGYFRGIGAGSDSQTHCLPDLDQQYAPDTPTTITPTFSPLPTYNLVVSGTASAVYNFTGNGQTINLCSSAACPVGGGVTIASGQKVVIRIKQPSGYDPAGVKNKVVIKANILYDRAVVHASIATIPSFVLITDPGVVVTFDSVLPVPSAPTVFNGIISARGDVNTCGDYDGSDAVLPKLTTTALSACTNALNYYGVLITSGSLRPYRTPGFDTAADTTPAESFTQYPETLLSHYYHSLTQPKITTDSQSELSPRL